MTNPSICWFLLCLNRIPLTSRVIVSDLRKVISRPDMTRYMSVFPGPKAGADRSAQLRTGSNERAATLLLFPFTPGMEGGANRGRMLALGGKR